MKPSSVLPAFVLSVVSAQVPLDWELLVTANAPPPRLQPVTTFDADRGCVVLFGGFIDAVRRFDDTWEWDGSWHMRTPAHRPPARYGHAMAYDPVRRKVVLFGGVYDEGGHGYFDDTWEWDGSNWTQRLPNNHPPALKGPAMAWDGVRQQIVCFGGRTGSTSWSDSTWAFDGSDWTHVGQGPPGRTSHAMAWDASRRRVVMFGGSQCCGSLSDTWLWDGAAWAQAQPLRSPPPRAFHVMCQDLLRQRIVMGGGGLNCCNDVWEWDGTEWAPIAVTQLPPPTIPALEFDAARGRTLWIAAVGGSLPATTTWQLWQPATEFGSGCGPRLSAINQARIGTTLRLGESGPPLSPAILWFGGSYRDWLGIPLPLDLTAAGLPGCALLVAMDSDIRASFTDAQGNALFDLAIPSDTSLLNQALWLQGATFQGFALPNLRPTNGLQVVIR